MNAALIRTFVNFFLMLKIVVILDSVGFFLIKSELKNDYCNPETEKGLLVLYGAQNSV